MACSMDYLKDFSIDIDSEIKYFLQQAIEAADIVVKDTICMVIMPPYSISIDLSGIDEILLWRKYSVNSDATSYHFVVSYLQRNGRETQAIHVPWLILI